MSLRVVLAAPTQRLACARRLRVRLPLTPEAPMTRARRAHLEDQPGRRGHDGGEGAALEPDQRGSGEPGQRRLQCRLHRPPALRAAGRRRLLARRAHRPERRHQSGPPWPVEADRKPSAFQKAHPVAHPDPEDFEPDGTWYSMIAIGRALYPMDSNHGELDRVTQTGAISRVIDISASQGHVVPTALTYHRGIYIANLGLFDPADRAGDEHVWRLTGHRTLKVRATGVEKVLGLAFRGGTLYALEMSTTAGAPTPGTGAIVRVNRHGPPETVVSGLTFPTGMTVGPDGAFYVSNQGFGFGAGQGQILRIQV